MQIDTNISTIRSKKTWTADEISQLYGLYSKQGLSAKEIAPMLRRTKTSVWVKIKRLKIRHSPSQTFRIKHDNTHGKNNPMYGKEAWCRGLTKENNIIVKNKAAKQSATRKMLFKKGILNLKGINNPMYGATSWSKGLTTETSSILKAAGEKQSLSRAIEWKNKPEVEKEKIRKRCRSMGARCRTNKTTIEIKIDQLLKNYHVPYFYNHNLGEFVPDFYLPCFNIVIECQGDYWHGNPIKYSDSALNAMQKNNINRDNRKKQYFIDNGIDSLFLWEQDINKNFGTVKEQIERFIMEHDQRIHE